LRSGQNNKSGGGLTGARGFVAPVPLTPREISQFRLEAKKYGLESVPDPTLGFTIGDMVEITDGPYAGERGPIRLVRNGGVMVRLFAYGQNFDLDFKPQVQNSLRAQASERSFSLMSRGVCSLFALLLSCSPFLCIHLPRFCVGQMVKVLFKHDLAAPVLPAAAQARPKQVLTPEEQARADARAADKKQRFEVRDSPFLVLLDATDVRPSS
jgi:hypothetical protein